MKHKLISGEDITGVADSGCGDDNNDLDRHDDHDGRESVTDAESNNLKRKKTHDAKSEASEVDGFVKL